MNKVLLQIKNCSSMLYYIKRTSLQPDDSRPTSKKLLEKGSNWLGLAHCLPFGPINGTRLVTYAGPIQTKMGLHWNSSHVHHTVTKHGEEVDKFLWQTTLSSMNPLYNWRGRKDIVRERRSTITRITVGRATETKAVHNTLTQFT